jgi:hypothetical protein
LQLPTINQVKALDHIQKYINVLSLGEDQINTLESLMQYSSKVNFNSITPQQQSQIAVLEQKIQDQENQITAANVILTNP